MSSYYLKYIKSLYRALEALEISDLQDKGISIDSIPFLDLH